MVTRNSELASQTSEKKTASEDSSSRLPVIAKTIDRIIKSFQNDSLPISPSDFFAAVLFYIQF